MTLPFKPRLPLEPLVRAARAEDSSAFARMLGFGTTKEMGQRWTRAQRHGLTPAMADRWACHLGFHPAVVWGEDWWAALELEEVGAR